MPTIPVANLLSILATNTQVAEIYSRFLLNIINHFLLIFFGAETSISNLKVSYNNSSPLRNEFSYIKRFYYRKGGLLFSFSVEALASSKNSLHIRVADALRVSPQHLTMLN